MLLRPINAVGSARHNRNACSARRLLRCSISKREEFECRHPPFSPIANRLESRPCGGTESTLKREHCLQKC
jgi:hypothetical protein